MYQILRLSEYCTRWNWYRPYRRSSYTLCHTHMAMAAFTLVYSQIIVPWAVSWDSVSAVLSSPPSESYSSPETGAEPYRQVVTPLPSRRVRRLDQKLDPPDWAGDASASTRSRAAWLRAARSRSRPARLLSVSYLFSPPLHPLRARSLPVRPNSWQTFDVSGI
jgi:hypothetical protein